MEVGCVYDHPGTCLLPVCMTRPCALGRMSFPLPTKTMPQHLPSVPHTAFICQHRSRETAIFRDFLTIINSLMWCVFEDDILITCWNLSFSSFTSSINTKISKFVHILDCRGWNFVTKCAKKNSVRCRHK